MKTDSELQKDVQEELHWDPLLTASEIGVAVKNGIVTLSGQVNTYGKKLAAENAAKRVKGVNAVATDIEVKIMGGASRSDTDIASAALNALEWNSFVPENKIKLKVDNGWITLEGEVEWEFERSSATKAVRNLVGVTGVSNFITVKPVVTAGIVKDVIRKALERNADIEAQKIDVVTSDRKVTLKGKVRSWKEREEVRRAVWSTPGISEVEDKLAIAP